MQKYTASFGCATNWGQTAQNTPAGSLVEYDRQPNSARPLISAEEFIIQYADLFGLYPADLAAQLTQRLQAQPVHYNTVLDGIALLRAFTPKVAAYQETHYGLLLRGEAIVGLVWLAAYTDRLAPEESTLVCYESETRPLMQQALALNADRVLLASTRHSSEHHLGKLEAQEMNRLAAGLEVFGVELLDYLLFFDDLNMSYAYWSHGERGLDDGVTKSELDRHYLDFPSAITFSLAH
ncbi:hypothetical protein WBJ53_04840 [Spirosoma sp. SC4-14]|uniref:hypothetical protein n=1 Tax=Spirosoma sp. SC4-14 TaxID=3128900 RepID=UPI0030D0E2ED